MLKIVLGCAAVLLIAFAGVSVGAYTIAYNGSGAIYTVETNSYGFFLDMWLVDSDTGAHMEITLPLHESVVNAYCHYFSVSPDLRQIEAICDDPESVFDRYVGKSNAPFDQWMRVEDQPGIVLGVAWVDNRHLWLLNSLGNGYSTAIFDVIIREYNAERSFPPDTNFLSIYPPRDTIILDTEGYSIDSGAFTLMNLNDGTLTPLPPTGYPVKVEPVWLGSGDAFYYGAIDVYHQNLPVFVRVDAATGAHTLIHVPHLPAYILGVTDQYIDYVAWDEFHQYQNIVLRVDMNGNVIWGFRIP